MKNIPAKGWVLYFLLLCCTYLRGQNASVTDYFMHTGEYSIIYSGEVEQSYNTLYYRNNPYYVNDEYITGSVVYKKIHYPNVKIRLDLHKEHLIALTPSKQYSKIVPIEDVDSIYIHNKVFFNHKPPVKSGLNPGYYLLLHNSKNIQLLGRSLFLLDFQKPEDKKSFSQKTNYYLVYNEKYHSVSNKRSFYKVFPEHKKTINKYVRENNLSFKSDKEKSLVILAAYCAQFAN